MKAPDGQEFWNAVEYHEIVLHEKIVSLMYFSDVEGNKVDPAQLGIEHEAIEGAYDVTLFEDIGNGQLRQTAEAWLERASRRLAAFPAKWPLVNC
jgi:uncharacterized protein YndB with AHSA1/START domain